MYFQVTFNFLIPAPDHHWISVQSASFFDRQMALHFMRRGGCCERDAIIGSRDGLRVGPTYCAVSGLNTSARGHEAPHRRLNWFVYII